MLAVRSGHAPDGYLLSGVAVGMVVGLCLFGWKKLRRTGGDV